MFLPIDAVMAASILMKFGAVADTMNNHVGNLYQQIKLQTQLVLTEIGMYCLYLKYIRVLILKVPNGN